MGATFADFLVAIRATKNLAHYLLVAQSFQCLVQALNQTHEEFYRVLLFSKIYRFSLEPAKIRFFFFSSKMYNASEFILIKLNES